MILLKIYFCSYVSEQGKDWKGTADFISWILKYWNIANVKTTRAGKT